MSTLAAGEIRTRGFRDDPALILLASILLHIVLVAVLLLIRLPDVKLVKPPAPISVTFIQPPPQPAPVDAVSPQPAPVTTHAPVQTQQPSAETGQDMLADAQAFAAMMQQSSQQPPMTVIKPRVVEEPPSPDPVMHVEGPSPAATSNHPGQPSTDAGGGLQPGEGEATGAIGAGAGNGGGRTGGLGVAGGGTFDEFVVVNVDGAAHSRFDPQLKRFTDTLVACGLRAVDSDNHSWMVSIDVTFTPDGSVTDIRKREPAQPSIEESTAADELMRVMRMPGCAHLAPSIFGKTSWHTGQIYLFPIDNPNVPFNLKPSSLSQFRAPDLRLTPH